MAEAGMRAGERGEAGAAAGRADGLIYTQEFGMLLGRAQRAPILRRELTGEYVPAGYTADEAWDALTVIRRSQAVVSPDTKRVGAANLIGWRTTPESLARSLRLISAHTQRGSLLDSLAAERSGRRFVTQQYIEEMLTNLRLDAFPSDYEEVRAALLGEVPPADDAQKLALNFHRIMNDMGDYADAPLDAGLLGELHARLTSGVAATPPVAEQHSPLEPFYVLRARPGAAPGEGALDEEMLGVVADIANDRLTDPEQHPVMTSMLVNCQFWHDAVFPRCNNLMGCVASRLYLYRHGFPVFRYVPKIALIWAWRNGWEKSPRGYTLEESHVPDGRLGVDWTPYYDTLMSLMLGHVLAMERSLGTRKAANDEVLEQVGAIPRLNARQADVLRRAVVDPGSEFRISWQRERYGVVYSTARADLEGLVEMGLLARGMAGSAYVYRPAPGLAARAADLARQAGREGRAGGVGR